MAKIDPTGKLPPYRQVANILAERITSGEYPKESKLPSESELMEEFEIGRSTVRRTLAWMREAKLVETIPTRGTYVL